MSTQVSTKKSHFGTGPYTALYLALAVGSAATVSTEKKPDSSFVIVTVLVCIVGAISYLKWVSNNCMNETWRRNQYVRFGILLGLGLVIAVIGGAQAENKVVAPTSANVLMYIGLGLFCVGFLVVGQVFVSLRVKLAFAGAQALSTPVPTDAEIRAHITARTGCEATQDEITAVRQAFIQQRNQTITDGAIAAAVLVGLAYVNHVNHENR